MVGYVLRKSILVCRTPKALRCRCLLQTYVQLVAVALKLVAVVAASCRYRSVNVNIAIDKSTTDEGFLWTVAASLCRTTCVLMSQSAIVTVLDIVGRSWSERKGRMNDGQNCHSLTTYTSAEQLLQAR